MTDWTPVLTALVALGAALLGYGAGYVVEQRRSGSARRARELELAWQRNERKRQELVELQRALGDHVVRMDELVGNALRHYRVVPQWQPLRAEFTSRLYESQLYAGFLATRTADEDVRAGSIEVISACDSLLGATTADAAQAAVKTISASLSKVDATIFDRLKALDSGLNLNGG